MALSCFIDKKVAGVRAKRERRKEARPGELLEAALDFFVEKGFAATRSEEVAKRAGVSKGTLFLYFPSKEELFKAVVRENISGRFLQWNEMFENFRGTTPEMLHTCMKTWWEKVGSTKASGISKLMMSEAGNFPDLAEFYRDEVVKPGHDLLARILQRGIDRGEFRPIDVNHAVYSLVAPMMFLVMYRHSGKVCVQPDFDLDPEVFLAQQVELLLHGALASPHAPTTSKVKP